MKQADKTVFINYRRDDSAAALAIFNWLTQNEYDTFIDYEGIPSGDFKSIIIENILSRAHFLAVLSPTAFSRCDEKGDLWRREIETAIDSARNIVPLFIGGFSFKDVDKASLVRWRISALANYNGLDLGRNVVSGFQANMQRLAARFLSVHLRSVIHPPSVLAVRAANDQKNAARFAIGDSKSLLSRIAHGALPLAPARSDAHAESRDIGFRIGEAVLDRLPYSDEELRLRRAARYAMFRKTSGLRATCDEAEQTEFKVAMSALTDPGEALSLLAQLLARHPLWSSGYYCRAIVYESIRDFERAHTGFTQHRQEGGELISSLEYSLSEQRSALARALSAGAIADETLSSEVAAHIRSAVSKLSSLTRKTLDIQNDLARFTCPRCGSPLLIDEPEEARSSATESGTSKTPWLIRFTCGFEVGANLATGNCSGRLDDD